LNYQKEYENNKAKKQLESWDRYVWAKSYLRRLKKTGVDVSHYFDFLVGKHYTLTEREFNEIKDFYEEQKPKKNK
jgi:hypothetical protein